LTRSVYLLIVVVALFLQLVGVSLAQTAELQKRLNAFIDIENVDGASFYANIDGKSIQVAVGTVDENQNQATQINSRSYIASTGKMMTATAILSLVEEGKLKLDAPVWPHIRSITSIKRLKNADIVTLRQLLNHSSGLAEYLTYRFGAASIATPSKRWSAPDALVFAFDVPARSTPGERFEYTNTNYVLLGHILSRFDGSIEAALQKRIFVKAGMSASSVGAKSTERNLARGFDETGYDGSEMAWASVLGDGAVVSSAKDVGVFMQALLRDNLLLPQKLIGLMTKGSVEEDGYGLGIGIDQTDHGISYGHAGSYVGFESDVRYYPELNAVLVVLFNGNPSTNRSFLDQAEDVLF